VIDVRFLLRLRGETAPRLFATFSSSTQRDMPEMTWTDAGLHNTLEGSRKRTRNLSNGSLTRMSTQRFRLS